MKNRTRKPLNVAVSLFCIANMLTPASVFAARGETTSKAAREEDPAHTRTVSEMTIFVADREDGGQTIYEVQADGTRKLMCELPPGKDGRNNGEILLAQADTQGADEAGVAEAADSAKQSIAAASIPSKVGPVPEAPRPATAKDTGEIETTADPLPAETGILKLGSTGAVMAAAAPFVQKNVAGIEAGTNALVGIALDADIADVPVPAAFTGETALVGAPIPVEPETVAAADDQEETPALARPLEVEEGTISATVSGETRALTAPVVERPDTVPSSFDSETETPTVSMPLPELSMEAGNASETPALSSPLDEAEQVKGGPQPTLTGTPDLESYYLAYSPSSPRDSDSITVTWKVKNRGTANVSTRFYTKLYVDGAVNHTWYTDALQVNYYVSASKNIGTLTSGQHTLKISTDTTGAVSESSETNNDYSKAVTIGGSGSPDLNPYELTLSPSSPTTASSVTAAWKVKN
jgi:hypothetical protein